MSFCAFVVKNLDFSHKIRSNQHGGFVTCWWLHQANCSCDHKDTFLTNKVYQIDVKSSFYNPIKKNYVSYVMSINYGGYKYP